MSYGNWITQIVSRKKTQRGRRQNAAAHRRAVGNSLLRLEALEDRRLLSTTTTALMGFPGTSQYGQSVALVAKVSTSPASPRGSGPTGTVEFWLNSVPAAYATTPAAPGTAGLLGTANVTQRGTAALYNESSPLPVGLDTIYAVYYGDTNFTASQGSAQETVNAAATHTIVYASPNPGVAGSSVTLTAVVSDAAPNWMSNGGTITPPTGTVSFLVNGFTETGTFVGDNGTTAIYTYTTTPTSAAATQSAPLSVGTNAIGGSFVATTGSNYQGSSSQNNTKYQVVAAASAGTGTITAAGATTGSPATLRGGQTLSLYYLPGNTSTTTPNTLTYIDKNNGIDLAGTVTSFNVVFGSNGKVAEISGTGTNTNGTVVTPVNFTLVVNTDSSGGWSHNPNVAINIVGNTPVTTPTGAGLYYSQTGSLASGSTITITGQSGGTTIPHSGGIPNDQVMGSWGGGGGDFGGFGGGGGGFGWGRFNRGGFGRGR